MKISRLTIALGSAPLVCANYVAPSTMQELTARSDTVIVGTVVEIGIPSPAAAADKIERGELAIGSLTSSPCVKVRVDKALKGSPSVRTLVCRHRISELNPKAVQLGKRYTMFLTNAGLAYVPTSWDAFRKLQ